jgi:hypothetical protein
LAKTWLYKANGGCAGEELKAIKYEAGEAQLQNVSPRRAAMSFYHSWEKSITVVFFT